MANHYRDMWARRSDVLAPLTKLVSTTAKWLWTEEQQKSFESMKQIISKETLLSYPDFCQPFDLQTDASHSKLRAILSQQNKSIAFYSRKLNPAQTGYTTPERKHLAIVETLKEFHNILLGQNIRVYTDHQYLTYKNFNTERVIRWRLILEEYGPEIIYVPGYTIVIADALSCLQFTPNPTLKENKSIFLAELFGAATI
jgi:RNase H-like domain found in reverse transcriptase